MPAFECRKDLAKFRTVGRGITLVKGGVIQHGGEHFPGLLVERCGQRLFYCGAHDFPESFRIHVTSAFAENKELFRKHPAGEEMIQSGQQFSPGEVAGRAEDDQAAGLRDLYLAAVNGPVEWGCRFHIILS